MSKVQRMMMLRRGAQSFVSMTSGRQKDSPERHGRMDSTCSAGEFELNLNSGFERRRTWSAFSLQIRARDLRAIGGLASSLAQPTRQA